MKEHGGNIGRVLEYLRNNKGITSMEAFELFGVTRLSAIIFNLRKNYDIESVKRNGVNRYGTKVRFDEYRLVGERAE